MGCADPDLLVIPSNMGALPPTAARKPRRVFMKGGILSPRVYPNSATGCGGTWFNSQETGSNLSQLQDPHIAMKTIASLPDVRIG